VSEVTVRRARDGWRSPAGIGTIAAVAGVLVAVLALFVNRADSGGAPAAAPSAEHTYFFVYGTTMPGHLRYSLIEDFVAEASPATVPGRLYDSGNGYPAAKFGGGQGSIEGYLLRLRPERVAEARRTFTEMEAGMFEPVTVTTDRGVTATAYEWIDDVDGLQRLDGMWNGDEQ